MFTFSFHFKIPAKQNTTQSNFQGHAFGRVVIMNGELQKI
jgi:hypothetical protein